jgi:SAM-dependent methyltransferase
MTNKISDNWYEDFFQGLNCELWVKAAIPEWTKLEIDFIINEFKLKHGKHILDIPCGFGRHSIELAKNGYHVTGVDISETFIHSLNQKVKSDKLTIDTIQGDILKVKLDRMFSGAICMGNSFGYFDFEKMKIFIEKVSTCLETGAKFIINSGMVAESILTNFLKELSYSFDDLKMDISNSYNIDESYLISKILYTKGDNIEEHSFKHYVFTIGEIKRLLYSFDLDIIGTYCSTDKKPYKFGDNQIYIVAQKC